MSCDVGEVTESLENEQSSFSKLSSLHLRHSSFSNPSGSDACKGSNYTEWKGNKCHPFKSRRGRLKGSKKFIYNMESKLDSFLSKKLFLVPFCSRRTAYIVRDNAKKFTSVDLSYKGVILFSKIFYIFDVVYVKSNRILC